MHSRWTDFLTSDGEKPDRNREAEFDNDITSRQAMMTLWSLGWKVLLDTLRNLTVNDLGKPF